MKRHQCGHIRCVDTAEIERGETTGKTYDATSGVVGRVCIALFVALLSNMASSADLMEYSSPVKRRKVDDDGGHGSINEVAMDPMTGETACASPNDDFGGIKKSTYAHDRMYALICGYRMMAAIERLSASVAFASRLPRASRRTP